MPPLARLVRLPDHSKATDFYSCDARQRTNDPTSFSTYACIGWAWRLADIMSRDAPERLGLFHGTERNGTERNAGLFHGTDKCDRGTIILILEYLTANGYYIVLIIVFINIRILIINAERLVPISITLILC